MAPETPVQTSQHSAIGPVFWGVATALAAAAAVTLIAAGWITLRGYPGHAQFLSVPLTDINAAAGEVEETHTGARLIPDERGVAIALFDGAPRFPAFQFSEINIDLANGTNLREGQVLWASRDAPKDTRRLPVERKRSTLSANLAESPKWADRVNGIGVALMTQGPVDLESVTLHPPEPTFSYVLTRLWREWTFREGYKGHTINRLKGAGSATLVPLGLAGGAALTIACLPWLLVSTRRNMRALRQPTIIGAVATLWILVTLPWIRELWTEASWSVDTYAGKSKDERRLAEGDAYLYEIAQDAHAHLPEEPVRLWVVGDPGPPGLSGFEKWKLNYYLAPHNTSPILPYLWIAPARNWVSPGDYLLVIGHDNRSFRPENGRINPGYPVEIIGTFDGNRLFRIQDS